MVSSSLSQWLYDGNSGLAAEAKSRTPSRPSRNSHGSGLTDAPKAIPDRVLHGWEVSRGDDLRDPSEVPTTDVPGEVIWLDAWHVDLKPRWLDRDDFYPNESVVIAIWILGSDRRIAAHDAKVGHPVAAMAQANESAEVLLEVPRVVTQRDREEVTGAPVGRAGPSDQLEILGARPSARIRGFDRA